MPDRGGTRRFWRKRRVRHPGHHERHPGPWKRVRNWFRRRSRGQRVGVYAAASILTAFVAAALLLLSPLTSMVVTPRIAEAIKAQLGPGYEVHIESSRVDVTANGLDLRLDGFAISEPGGAPVLAVPSAAIALDGNLLVSQQVLLRRVRLTQPKLTLGIEANGQVVLAGAEGGAPLFSLPAANVPQAAPAEIFGFLSAAEAVLQPGGPFANFELAEVQSADITIIDQRRGRQDRVEHVDFRLQRGKDNRLIASASSAASREQWTVSATLSGQTGGERNFDLGFENLSLGRIIYELLRGAAPADFGGRLFGHMYARLASDGTVPVAEARLDIVGFSVVERDKPETRMDIERARAQLAWSTKDHRLRIVPIEVFAHNSRFSLGGYARPVDPAADQWEFSIAGTEQPVPGSDPRTHALRFDRIEASGQLERAARRVTFDKASVQGRSLSVAGHGTFDFSGDRPTGDFAIAGSRSPVAAVLRIWPGLVAPNARKWVDANVKRAMVEDVTIAMRGPIGGKMLHRDIALDARFTDAVINYLDHAPPAVGVHGFIRVVDEKMETVIEGGRVELGAAEPLSIGGTRFSSLEYRPNPFQGELVTRIEGPVSTIGALMAVPRLAEMAPGVAPLMRGRGTISAELSLTGEYGQGSNPSLLVPRISAGLSGWSMAKAVGERDIDNGNFTLSVEPASANLRGEVSLSGAPLAVEAILNRTPDNKFGETIVRFSIDPSKMKDFDNEALRIAGPVSAELVQDAPGVLPNSRMRADLTGASVEGPVGLAKASGAPGQVSFTIQPNGENWRLENFVAQGSGIDIRGFVDIAKAGKLAGAKFSHFAASNGDDTQLDVTKTGNAYRIVAQGSSFNAQPILKDIVSGAPEKRALDIDVEARLGTIIGHNGEIMSGADIRVSRRNNTTQNLHIAGVLGAGAVEGRTTGGEANMISIRAADAGAVLRFIDLYRRMRGGQFSLDVVPGETSNGRLKIQNFQVIGDQQLASVASNRPDQRAANNTMTFTQMTSKFRLGGGRILIDDFEVYGNELGATLGGEINYAQDRIGISGTFVPAYALNNLFGRLPLLGPILGGGSDGGLVGITFAIDGPWTSPQMRVNPLSAVAPGFLRKIFEFRNQSPSANPQTPPDNISGGRPAQR